MYRELLKKYFNIARNENNEYRLLRFVDAKEKKLNVA